MWAHNSNGLPTLTVRVLHNVSQRACGCPAFQGKNAAAPLWLPQTAKVSKQAWHDVALQLLPSSES